MKKILAGLSIVLAASTWASGWWFETTNQAGGKILLLSTSCHPDDRTGRMVISTSPSGDSMTGCWYYFADHVHVVWFNGRTSSFATKDFAYKTGEQK